MSWSYFQCKIQCKLYRNFQSNFLLFKLRNSWRVYENVIFTDIKGNYSHFLFNISHTLVMFDYIIVFLSYNKICIVTSTYLFFLSWSKSFFIFWLISFQIPNLFQDGCLDFCEGWIFMIDWQTEASQSQPRISQLGTTINTHSLMFTTVKKFFFTIVSEVNILNRKFLLEK